MEELFAGQMPASVEAEQAVLGSILIDPSCVQEVIGQIKPTDFYYPENKAIFETIYSMFTESQKIDAVTVLDRLKVRGIYDEAGGRSYLLQLMEVTPTAANVGEYCRVVRDKSMLRDVYNVSGEILKLASQGGGGDASDIVELAEQKIYAIRGGREIKGLVHIKSAIREVYDRLEELAKNPSGISGIPTGMSEIDNFIGGLNKSDLILVAARPGMGKTSIALNMALNAAKKTDKSVVIFQLEMSKEQVASRFLSNEALVDSHKLRSGELNAEEWVKIARASSVLSGVKIYIDDNPAITVGEMKAKCRRMSNELGLVVIDYLQLMQSGKRSENRVNEISEISRGLKIMAKELNVPVLCLSQLSRGPESRQDKRPMLSDLRESGAIEQDADIVMFLYRDEYYNEQTEDRNVAECIIAKNRHGSTGTVKLQWLGQFTTFSGQDRIHNDQAR